MNEHLKNNTDTDIHGFKVGDIVKRNIRNQIYEVVTYAEWLHNNDYNYVSDLSPFVPVRFITGQHRGKYGPEYPASLVRL